MSERIGLRELRQHASRYVDAAARGETIEITKHGRLVARIVPAAPDPDDRYAQLVASGVIEPADSPGGLADIVPLPVEPGTTPLSEVIRQMRDEERY